MLNFKHFAIITFFGMSVLSASMFAQKAPALDPKNMDLNIKPGDDFFRYANGAWMKSNPIPDEYSRWGSFNILQELNNDNLKALVDEVSKMKAKKGSVEQQIGDLFASGMDEARIDKLGATPLNPYFAQIEKMKNKKDLANLLGKFHAQGLSGLFGFYAGQDEKNSNMIIMSVYQGGLGMGNRDYYTEEDAHSKELRVKYVEYIANMFELLGESKDNAKKYADNVMALETKLAVTSLTRVEQRDPIKNYNKMSFAEFKKLVPEFDFTDYFKALGKSNPGDINVTSMKFFQGINDIIKNTPMDDWKLYMKWQTLNDNASFLSSKFVDANFDFFGTVFSGKKKNLPRWKRVLNIASGSLGEAIGQIYVKKYFPPEAKSRMLELVGNLRRALDLRISNLTWMSDVTKAKAKEKLAAINVKIGYPDKWKSYKGLDITRENYFQNLVNASAFEVKYQLSKIGKPVDRTEWDMTPQTVNAYYSPNMNEIVFPAAILQPPFFSVDADDAVNYGGIGGVIGHEMTHGFDDQGRQYDKFGNLNDWWTADDAKNFEAHTKVIVDQYNNYKILDSHVNGELTLGENIADLGGITVAWEAYKMAQKGKNVGKIDGFTPEQRFLLSWAQVWRTNVRDEEALKRLRDDVHSPAETRVNAIMPNFPLFYEAFGVKPGEKLYRAPEARAVIW